MTLAAITAATSQLDTARPAEAEMANSSAAAQYIADGCLVDAPLGRVGLELEAHCFDPVDPHRRPSWDEITEVLELLPPAAGRQRGHRRTRRRHRTVRPARGRHASRPSTR